MAITYTDSNFGTLIIPEAVSRINVQTPAAGLGTFGIVTIVGEADAGPATSASTENIENNFYTPSQLGNLVSKYQSGKIVEAFKALVAPSNDTNIVGALTRIYVYKTNPSTAASSLIPSIGGTYGSYAAALAGVNGNQLIWTMTTAQSAVDPTTGAFTYIPVPANGTSSGFKYRLEGGAETSVTINANVLPSAVAASASSGNMLAIGGIDRAAVSGLAGVTVSITVSGNNATFQLGGTNVFATSPVAGDLMLIPSNGLYNASATSTLAGTGSANLGAWVVTAISNVTSAAIITATKLADNVNVSPAAPVNFAATLSTTVGNDLQILSPLQFIDKTGTNRSSFASLPSAACSVTVTGSSLRFNLTGATNFATGLAAPQVNDNIFIPSGSAIAGAGSANVGWYTITTVNAVTSSAFVVASRLSNGAPVNVAATTLTAAPNADIQVLRPWIDGQEKEMEIVDVGNTTALSKVVYNLGTTTPATFISSSILPVIEIGTGYKVTAQINRSLDNIQEAYTNIGDNVVLQLGYAGTTGSVNVSATAMTFTVTGGSGANQTIVLSNFSNINALVSYIGSLTGYTAAAATAAAGQLPVSALDQGTFGICTSTSGAALPGRIKRDAYDFKNALSGSPTTVFTATATAGLPNPSPLATFMSGGAKGGSSGANFTAAADACQAINTNFIIPVVSQDASADVLIGGTDPSSTYTVAAINAYFLSHCLAMSVPKKRKNRLAVCSFRGSFLNAIAAAQNLASSRAALTFQDVKAVSTAGVITQFQPWYGACVAAGMQAIGLYKSIMRKYANISGIVSPQNDFSPNNDGQLEQALLGGLLTLQAPSTGGFRWVSDQTTYGKDANFVFNSLQVMYTADYMAIDLANSFDNFAVGQAITDVNAPTALTFLTSKMTQYFQNKLIASSTTAPAGYDSATVSINGPVMLVGVNAYVTNAISFVLITFNVSQASQSS